MKRAGHALDFFHPEFGVHRQREFLSCPLLCAGYVSMAQGMLRPRGMTVDRDGIVSAGLDPAQMQRCSDGVTVGKAYREQVVNARRMAALFECANLVREQRPVAKRMLAACRVPRVEMAQFDS